jgi:bacillolysin
MKRSLSFLSALFIALQSNSQISEKLAPYALESMLDAKGQLTYITFKETHKVNEADVTAFIDNMILNNGACKAIVSKSEKDNLGFTNTKYNIAYKGTNVFNKVIIAHVKDGKLQSLNGDLCEFKAPQNKMAISEKSALSFALKKVNAKIYKWQVKEEEAAMKRSLNQPNFTYYPKGAKVLFEKEGKIYYAYQFNIYAHEPLYRANVFVDAASGKILAEQNLIHNTDIQGSAATRYRGTQTFTCDNNGGTYRLRETARGLGIQTYNLQNSNVYNNVDFTNATPNWTIVNNDRGARDAHWGAENTYDYYMQVHNRNSIDNAGYALLSYVHYNSNYNNAFWDGTRMTYGDGDGTQFTILTGQDVCGHEITHGLVSNTGGLNGGEADALNEAFADIFGTSIERFALPGTWDWIMGAEITPGGGGIRNMSNPNSMNDPDTYLGTYWDNGGEPHNNAGPCDYWFYLLTVGGNGTNDLSNTYSVTGLGNVAAERIAFRALTVYFTPGTNYANARVCAIQAAKDLYGACSNEVIQTTNAWYAVGVGAQYVPGAINPNFNGTPTSMCNLPATVNFNNTTNAGLSYTWYFGDGATSTATNPAHTYTANGTYNVKLVATGCISGADSITQNSYVVINAPNSPSTTGSSFCIPGSVNLFATGNGSMNWYATQGSTVVINTGTAYTTPILNNTTTYYVVNSVSNTPANGGILTNVGGGNLNNPNQWLVFNATQAGTLQSVVVYASAAGLRTFEMRSSGNVVMNTTTMNLVVGTNTVILNYNLTPGTGYQLGLNSGSSCNLYRSNSGVTYPYNVGNVVNITSSSAGSAYYYWFYNWQVIKANCTSAYAPVTANYGTLAVSATAAQTNICHDGGTVALTGNPTGGTFAGPGVTGNAFDPTLGNGTYTLMYTYSNGPCTDSAFVVVNVSQCTGIAKNNLSLGEIILFPNPANEFFTIKNAADLNYSMTDAAGRIVKQDEIKSNEEKINLRGLALGIYFIRIGEGLRNYKLLVQ